MRRKKKKSEARRTATSSALPCCITAVSRLSLVCHQQQPWGAGSMWYKAHKSKVRSRAPHAPVLGPPCYSPAAPSNSTAPWHSCRCSVPCWQSCLCSPALLHLLLSIHIWPGSIRPQGTVARVHGHPAIPLPSSLQRCR